MVEFNIAKPMDSNESLLHMPGDKVSTGRELSLAESLMAMTASAVTTRNRYGPGPDDMGPPKRELPEVVKGVLANYIGV